MPYIYKSGQQFGMGNITINTPTRELTQAQYEALPASEKSNGTIYFITDASSDKIVVNDPAPIGAIMAYGGATAPGGWLLCQGQAVSRTTYSELFAAIGTAYGSGNGSTTFNLPDLRGRTITGVGTLNNNTYTLGEQKDAGLPNITGGFTARTTDYSTSPIIYPTNGTNAFAYTSGGQSGDGVNQVNGSQSWYTYTFDASRVNSIYGNSTTVQSSTTVTNYIIKAKDQSLSDSSMLTMVDFFYPVGSYYETSSSSLNPNTTFGGTWTLDNKPETVAWIVWHDGSIVNGYGITSITATSTGTYLCTFTEPMINTNYSILVSSEVSGRGLEILGAYPQDTTKFIVDVTDRSGTAVTPVWLSIEVKGTKATPTLYRWHRTA